MEPYAKKSYSRFRQYAQAYESNEVKTWIDSLSPEQRAHAEKLGLLSPLPENLNGITPLDEGKVIEEIQAEDKHSLASLLSLFEKNPRKIKALNAIIYSKKHGAELKWAAMRYICGEGTCRTHAERFGMTKQNFHAIVKKLRLSLECL